MRKGEEEKKKKGRVGGRGALIDIDRSLLGKKVIIHLTTGQTLTARVATVGTYWVLVETNGGRKLMLNKSAIAYYEVTEQ